jgi:hypothetical protein
MAHPEAALQRQITGYLSWAVAPPAVYTAFPAGGGGLVRGAILKSTGLKAGMPDIFIFHDKRTYGIELKAGSGLSDAQKAMHVLLRQAGVQIAVVRSLDQLRELLVTRWWTIPIRETKESTELIRRGFKASAEEIA